MPVSEKPRHTKKTSKKSSVQNTQPWTEEAILGFHDMVKELLKLIRQDTPIKDDDESEEFRWEYCWSGLYDAPFAVSTQAFFQCISPELTLSTFKGMPLGDILKWANIHKSDLEEALESPLSSKQKNSLDITFIVFMRNIQAVATYGMTINALLDAGMKNDKHFFNAVRIDPTAIDSRKLAKRIRCAAINDDKAFLTKLGDALKGKAGKPADYYSSARVVVYAINELGHLRLMSEKERRNLLIRKLNLAADTPDSADSFARFLRRLLANK